MSDRDDDVEQLDEGAERDDSGEHALALLTGRPDDEHDAGVIGHLREVDHALYRRGLLEKALVAMLVLSFAAVVLNYWMTAQRSHDISRLRETADRIEDSEATNQELNRQMIETLARLEGAIGRAEAASVLVAEYVEQAQAAAAAGQGQGAAVARGLTQIERLVVGLEELLGGPLPAATSETPTSSPTGG